MTRDNVVFRSFSKGSTSPKSMARLREILSEPDNQSVSEYVEEKFARLSNAFNPDALSNSAEDDSYEWEEPGMSMWASEVHDADNIINNTGINPLMFEEWIDTEARQNVLRLHAQAQKLKDVKEISEKEKEERDKIEWDKKKNPHYRQMSVVRESNWSVRRFYRNWSEWYETRSCDDGYLDEDERKNPEEERRKRNRKVAVQLLYKKLWESRKAMKRAFNNRKYTLANEFKKEYEYCSKNLDALKACDEKIKQLRIKRRKDNLYTKRIKINNEGSKITINDVKKMINEKSLAYAEAVVNKEYQRLFR